MDCDQLTAGAVTVFLQTWTHGAGIQTEAPEATGPEGGPGKAGMAGHTWEHQQ